MQKVKPIEPSEKDPSIVVLIEDDHIIRYVIKKLISSYFKATRYKIFTSADGVEGLGYIYITHPDVIIVDSTLPEYGGREIADYVKTNDKVNSKARKVIVLTFEGSSLPDIPQEYSVLDKSSNEFITHLLNSLKLNLEAKNSQITNKWPIRFIFKLARPVIKYANASNRDTLLIERSNSVSQKGVYFIKWLWDQFLTSLFLALFFLFTGERDHDLNTIQGKKDLTSSRIKVFPALALIYVFLLALIIKGVATVSVFLWFWIVTALNSLQK